MGLALLYISFGALTYIYGFEFLRIFSENTTDELLAIIYLFLPIIFPLLIFYGVFLLKKLEVSSSQIVIGIVINLIFFLIWLWLFKQSLIIYF